MGGQDHTYSYNMISPGYNIESCLFKKSESLCEKVLKTYCLESCNSMCDRGQRDVKKIPRPRDWK